MICRECKHIQHMPVSWDGVAICPQTGMPVDINREIPGCPYAKQRHGGRRSGAGGVRVGAGAPRGNFNALKHGQHSKQIKAGIWPPGL
jgi:hypothetical protein